MSIAQQLYQLQEVDLELAANQQQQAQVSSQLGESQEITRVKAKLEAGQQRLEELERQQHDVEWEIDDLTTKLVAVEENLFSGKIRNPKELTNLQHEADELKVRRSQMEDRALEVMDQAESTTKSITNLTDELSRLEAEWSNQQEKLSAELAKLGVDNAKLSNRRQQLVEGIIPATLEIYEQLRLKRGTAVARVEQGTCRGCQITLPTTELQQVRGGGLVRCGSCGRILFLA